MPDATAPSNFIAPTAYVLDDEPGVRAFVVHVLSKRGFDAVQFSNPPPMLAKLKSAPPNLIICDLALGQSDAIEVIRELAMLNYAGKVLLISGRDEATLTEIQRIGERHGLAMLPSLRKPFRADELMHRLAALPQVVPAIPHPQQSQQNSQRPTVGLAEALRNNWLELWYQPKIELKSFALCGAEALVRVRHPQHGIVLPAAFLPPGNDPLHHDLAQFVLRRAINDWSRFADQGMALKLAINIPVSVIQAAEFIDHVRHQLPTDPRFPGLIVELTEDEIVKDATWIHEISTQLKLYNVWISIDDFGSAYSSLSRLLELPCVELKLDRVFVSNCSTDRLKHALCQTVVDLAHRVGTVVCAEGVENADELECLVQMGCDVAQGYLFAKPLPPDEFIKKVSQPIASQQHVVDGTGRRSRERSSR